MIEDLRGAVVLKGSDGTEMPFTSLEAAWGEATRRYQVVVTYVRSCDPAYLELGRLLLALREKTPFGLWLRALDQRGIHAKRAERAMRMAKAVDAGHDLRALRVGRKLPPTSPHQQNTPNGTGKSCDKMSHLIEPRINPDYPPRVSGLNATRPDVPWTMPPEMVDEMDGQVVDLAELGLGEDEDGEGFGEFEDEVDDEEVDAAGGAVGVVPLTGEQLGMGTLYERAERVVVSVGELREAAAGCSDSMIERIARLEVEAKAITEELRL